MTKPAQTRAAVRGVELAVRRSGAGPDLVWGHGLTSSMAIEDRSGVVDWARVPARVVRYDAGGHGDSGGYDELPRHGWEERAHDQLELATHLGIERYIAAGASMGCGTALHAAVLAPERVSGLVLVIPPTGWEARAAQTVAWDTAAALVEAGGVDALVDQRAAQPVPDPYAVEADHRRGLQAWATRRWTPTALAAALRGAKFADLPGRAQVAEIRCPALILAWTGDAIHPSSMASELDALLPHSSLSIATTRDELDTWSDRVAAFVAALGQP